MNDNQTIDGIWTGVLVFLCRTTAAAELDIAEFSSRSSGLVFPTYGDLGQFSGELQRNDGPLCHMSLLCRTPLDTMSAAFIDEGTYRHCSFLDPS